MPPGNQSKSISIRQSLLRNLLLLVLAVSGAVLVVTILAGRNIVREISHTVIDSAATQTRMELDHFFETIHHQVLISQSWAADGLLDAGDPQALNAKFVPVLRNNPQISSMMVTDSAGVGYVLLRDALDPDKWMNRVVRVGAEGSTAEYRYWNDRAGTVREEKSEIDYDPRTRIWYSGSLETDRTDPSRSVHWTKPVIFYLTKDPGVTAGSHASLPDGRKIVVAFDLLLIDISRLTTRRIRPSDNGTAFVFVEDTQTRELRVVGLPRDPEFDNEDAIRRGLIVSPQAIADSNARLPLADDFSVGPVAAAVRSWRQQSEPRDGCKFRFLNDGGHWWGELKSYDLGQNRFWIGVAVPESDFLSDVNHQFWTIIGIELLALVAAIAMAIVLARSYGVPIEKLAATSRLIRELNLDADTDVSSRLLEIRDLAQSQRELITAMESFVRYVPLEVVRELVKRGDVARIGGSTMPLTILFTDIQGFTSIAEQMEPQQLAEHMAEYFNVMLEELGRRHATVDKFVGDAIVAFWGAPRPDADHDRNALESVLACRRSLASMNKRWQDRGLPTMVTRFGLATGEVVVGNIGAETRLNYTVLGDTVNLAARLEGLNKLYGTRVLVSGDTYHRVGEDFEFRRVDRVAVVGKTETVDIYELLGYRNEVPAETIEFARAYENVLDEFQSGKFDSALAAAHQLNVRYPGEQSVEYLVDLCSEYLGDPPQEPWDGANRLTRKY